jgi:hypothetical protein
LVFLLLLLLIIIAVVPATLIAFKATATAMISMNRFFCSR